MVEEGGREGERMEEGGEGVREVGGKACEMESKKSWELRYS